MQSQKTQFFKLSRGMPPYPPSISRRRRSSIRAFSAHTLPPTQKPACRPATLNQMCSVSLPLFSMELLVELNKPDCILFHQYSHILHLQNQGSGVMFVRRLRSLGWLSSFNSLSWSSVTAVVLVKFVDFIYFVMLLCLSMSWSSSTRISTEKRGQETLQVYIWQLK